ncbi:hypothetical protein HanIR_Chr10g0486311 [Helianthus annuus]|nr:hypothetical protein HanIR_Chr10g0486311 [Helianthus annuus]
MFLYANMFSICSDMFYMFCTHLIMPPIMYGVMLPIMFSICSDICTHMVMFPISIGLTMYQFLDSTSVCVGFGNSYVYVYLLFPYHFLLQFHICSFISFCISHVPPFVFSNCVNDRFSSVSVQFCSVLLCNLG